MASLGFWPSTTPSCCSSWRGIVPSTSSTAFSLPCRWSLSAWSPSCGGVKTMPYPKTPTMPHESPRASLCGWWYCTARRPSTCRSTPTLYGCVAKRWHSSQRSACTACCRSCGVLRGAKSCRGMWTIGAMRQGRSWATTRIPTTTSTAAARITTTKPVAWSATSMPTSERTSSLPSDSPAFRSLRNCKPRCCSPSVCVALAPSLVRAPSSVSVSAGAGVL
mmetsp:Transcript_9256/g.26424  ORF Transcript_9256/g.26424 Transcript_9256/m.26424 type:complete len:220 (+) Transcript_9256:755-1414(+)